MREITAWDLNNIKELLKYDYEIPSFSGDYLFYCNPYTPTAYIGRTCLNGAGSNWVSEDRTWYRPRSRRYNPRWAARKLELFRRAEKTN